MEIFREIKDFEGLYEISNYGNVKSLKNNIILKCGYDKDGYYILCLHKDGKQYCKRVHRLVANAFLPNPDNLPQVNHKDENKQNNFVWINEDGSVDYEKSNLEWCDGKYNSNYWTGIERRVAKESKQVVAVDNDGNIVLWFASTMEAQRNGFDHAAVGKCCNSCYGKLGNFYKGYYWFFVKSDWLYNSYLNYS